MKVLHVGMGWFPEDASGLNRVYYHLNQALLDEGVSTHGLVVAKQPRDRAELGAERGTMQVFSTPQDALWHRLRSVRKAAREAVEAYEPDVVASHFALFAYPALSLWDHLPYVVHFHGPWALESSVEGGSAWSVWVKKQIERRVYRRADHCIVLSEAFRQVLHQQYGIPLERISIGTGGVDCAAFDTGSTMDDARVRLDWPKDRPIVLSVRRLAHRMGLENLIAAFQDVVLRCPEALLYIAGKGPLEATLRAQIATLGLEHSVRLLGFVPNEDLPWTYRAATVSVVPTVALEGFGLITVESLAAGTPPLVTPVGGLPEILRPFAPELILPGSQTGDLARGIGDALLGRLPLPSTEACQAYAREAYDWSVAADFAASVYERVRKG